ncbi:hypothetical protein PaeBR_11065 [Paenibacillus sp. BR2-3]|uniref:hypothetical protein n=1 Tax=Paenibacillus sp. BR2-3 TaxID=3048494 RepID=UPI0039777CF5
MSGRRGQTDDFLFFGGLPDKRRKIVTTTQRLRRCGRSQHSQFANVCTDEVLPNPLLQVLEVRLC